MDRSVIGITSHIGDMSQRRQTVVGASTRPGGIAVPGTSPRVPEHHNLPSPECDLTRVAATAQVTPPGRPSPGSTRDCLHIRHTSPHQRGCDLRQRRD
ncbi:hypothetical protein MBT84_09190 [Streptomyces sp. MBT84]|nr:hypothetical protein [Streptomyces sp. MBT84]